MNIFSWMVDRVRYFTYIGQAGNGEKKYEESYKNTRIEMSEKITSDEYGNVVVGKGTIITRSEIHNEDKFIYKNNAYTIISCNEYKDKNGIVNHYEGVFV